LAPFRKIGTRSFPRSFRSRTSELGFRKSLSAAAATPASASHAFTILTRFGRSKRLAMFRWRSLNLILSVGLYRRRDDLIHGVAFRLGLILRFGLTLSNGAVGRDLVKVLRLFQLHKVGNVEERIAFQSNIDKGRLHSRKYAGYAAFVDGTCQGVFIFPLKVDFCE
jgi:hypothetical protein